MHHNYSSQKSKDLKVKSWLHAFQWTNNLEIQSTNHSNDNSLVIDFKIPL